MTLVLLVSPCTLEKALPKSCLSLCMCVERECEMVGGGLRVEVCVGVYVQCVYVCLYFCVFQFSLSC